MKEISSVNGVCLSLEERIKNMKILDQLKSDIKCDEMQFWGKIIGAKKYYYISKALYYKGSPNFQKKYFFFPTILYLVSSLTPRPSYRKFR